MNKNIRITLITLIYVSLSIATSMLRWHFHHYLFGFLFSMLGGALILIYLLLLKKILNKISTSIIILIVIELLAFFIKIIFYPYFM